MTLSGAMTALITPFRDGAVDHEALAALVERQIERGIDGLVPCGTTGEAATMNEEEQLSVIRTVVEAADGRVPIVAGTGTNDTEKTVSYTQKVANIDGVDAALVVVPYYNKPDQRGLLGHFRAVADRGGLPVVLYNVPGRTVRSFTPETVGRLADHDNIVAIKEATGDLRFGSEVLEAVDGRIEVLSGDDFTTFPLMAAGGVGCISVVSNVAPGLMQRMCGAALEGDLETARALHLKIQPLARALFAAPNPAPAKQMAALLGLCEPTVRRPLAPVSATVRERLDQLIDDFELGDDT